LIGELNGSTTSRIKAIAEVFNRAGILTDISSNIQGVLWSKIMVNVGINAITALTGLRNGELMNFPEIKLVMKRAVMEAQEVAIARGIDIGIEDPIEKVFEVAEATATNRSSMLQDIDKGRKTEIDAINGFIVELGRRYGVDTPVNEVLTAAVIGLENISLHAEKEPTLR
jgi:2-dehydropantoate 2-reductase